LGAPGTPRDRMWPYSVPGGSREAHGGQKDRTRSNWCFKERKEERKTRGSKGTWKGPYIDPKKASKKNPMGPHWGPKGAIMNLKGTIGALWVHWAPITFLRGPIGALRASSG
jgi:hypothetical protein